MVLYVAKRFETNIAACVHRAAIEEMAGKEQVFVVNLRISFNALYSGWKETVCI